MLAEASKRLGIKTRELIRLMYMKDIRYVMVDGIAHIPEDAIDEYKSRGAVMAIPTVGASSVELTRDDLTVLDIALSYLMDELSKNPQILATVGEKNSLYSLHSHVLTLKRGE